MSLPEFSAFVKAKRVELGLSPGAAAKRLGMLPQKLSEIEHGRRYCKRISASLLQQFSVGYGIPMSELVAHTNQLVRNDASLDQILATLAPSISFALGIVRQLRKECETLPEHIDMMASELEKNIEEINGHYQLLRMRNVEAKVNGESL